MSSILKEKQHLINTIEVKGLSKKYNTFFLDHINLVVPKGYIVGLIRKLLIKITLNMKKIKFQIFGLLFLVAKFIQEFNIPLLSLEIIYDLTPIIPFIAIALLAIIAFISYQASTRIVDKKEY